MSSEKIRCYPYISKIYKCDCTCSALEWIPDDFLDTPSINLCIWRNGSPNSGKRSLRDRIRWCWRMLTHGQMYTDDIILTDHSVQVLVTDLNTWLEENKNKLEEKKSVE